MSKLMPSAVLNTVLNESHDPARKSWVESANAPGADFPIQNLPFSVVRRAGSGENFRPATAIGDFALDLKALAETGIAKAAALDACRGKTLNPLMGLGREALAELRAELSGLLADDSARVSEHAPALRECLIPLAEVEHDVPARIGDYTDFYASIYHATNIGALFRPDNPLLPNYEWVPIGYHGRASSIGVSGQSFPRPVGQIKPADSDVPVVAPCRRLDYELEVGVFVGTANPLGEPVHIERAEDHIFGLCLMNDWSARDIQAWEYQPLGPFLSKSFATTLSPWIVTLDALAPFRAPPRREPGRPAPLPYLDCEANSRQGAVDMQLEVLIHTQKMRNEGAAPQRISASNLVDAYWTVGQMLTHHTVNGCNLRAGDLFGTGTMSGAEPGSEGALIEITRGGAEPLQLENGESRTFLEDGDTVILRGRCEREGAVGIGLGEVAGTVEPARTAAGS